MTATTRTERLWPYLVAGVYLGFVMTRGEVVSWFRIQEMFRFQSIHMYGVLGSAVAVAAIGVALLKRLGGRSVVGRPLEVPSRELDDVGPEHALGGVAFGLGWGLLGACPGPIYVLIGNGLTVMVVALVAALMGVLTYARVRHLLPHR